MTLIVIDAAIPSTMADEVSNGPRGTASTSPPSLTVREHVRHHRELVVERRVGPQELVDLVRDRALPPPLDEGVEQQLVTSNPDYHSSAPLPFPRTADQTLRTYHARATASG